MKHDYVMVGFDSQPNPSWELKQLYLPCFYSDICLLGLSVNASPIASGSQSQQLQYHHIMFPYWPSSILTCEKVESIVSLSYHCILYCTLLMVCCYLSHQMRFTTFYCMLCNVCIAWTLDPVPLLQVMFVWQQFCNVSSSVGEEHDCNSVRLMTDDAVVRLLILLSRVFCRLWMDIWISGLMDQLWIFDVCCWWLIN